MENRRRRTLKEKLAEDERGERNYLGSELYDHIYSKHLPGQFFTFGGKYYEMLYLTAEGQVLIRRAADHITGRPMYRQIRDYTIEGIIPSEMVGSSRDVDGLKVSRMFADISVDTLGYYRMSKYDDFETAHKVLFDSAQKDILDKNYKNKEILAIDLPEADGLTDEVRYTITLLMNEVFRTIFADEYALVSAVTDCSFMGEDVECRPLTYSYNSSSCDHVPGRIYIMEDSQLDIGLINAVDRNLHRIFGIICDFLDWHDEMLRTNGDVADDEPTKVIFTEGETAGDDPKRRGLGRIIDRIKDMIKKQKPIVPAEPAEPEEPVTPEEEEPSEPADEEPVEAEEPAEPEATEPAEPEEPVTPAEEEPSEPADEEPVEAEEPAEPAEPEEPEQPLDAGGQDELEVPVGEEEPSEPADEEPVEAEEPEEPVTAGRTSDAGRGRTI